MKVVFLDFDGVLNSAEYDRRKRYGDPSLDRSRMPLLRELIGQTDAKIVLTTSWRIYWDANIALCDEIGRDMVAFFAEYGLTISDKTPRLGALMRPQEIMEWLSRHPEVHRYVILDDMDISWGLLSPYVVKTDYEEGKGLEEWHVARAIELLNA